MEGGAEVGAFDVGVAGGFGVVDIFAFAAVEFYGLHADYVGHSGGEEGLGVAVDAGAFAELGFFVFFDLWGWGLRVVSGEFIERFEGWGLNGGVKFDEIGGEGELTILASPRVELI